MKHNIVSLSGKINKKKYLFPVTCLKKLGSVGQKNLLFFSKEVMAKLFFQLILLLLHPNTR